MAIGSGTIGAMAALAAIARYGTGRKALSLSLFAGAFAFAFAFAVAVAFEGTVAGAVAGTFAGTFAVAGAPADAVAVAVAIILFQLNIAWRIRKKDSRFALLIEAANAVRSIGGTRFAGADLTSASFTKTNMTGVNLGDANLTHVNWQRAQNLDECVHEDDVLKQPAARELLTTRHGKARTYVRIDLHGTSLSGADLRDANLKETNCAGTDFTGADLTGACIESWNIDASTKLRDVRCRFVFLLEEPNEDGDRKRRPADLERSFAPGEFEKLYTKLMEQMEILLRKGLSPAAMRAAFAELGEKHPDVKITKLEDRGEEHVLVGLTVPAGSDMAEVDRTLVNSWEMKWRIAEAEKRMLEAHTRDIKEVALAHAAAAGRR
jgi:hypothetical protein